MVVEMIGDHGKGAGRRCEIVEAVAKRLVILIQVGEKIAQMLIVCGFFKVSSVVDKALMKIFEFLSSLQVLKQRRCRWLSGHVREIGHRHIFSPNPDADKRFGQLAAQVELIEGRD